MHYRELCGSYECIPDEKVKELIVRYGDTLKVPAPQWIEDTLKKYEVEYVLWDKKQDPLWNPARFSFLKEAADFGETAVYRIEYEN